MGTPDRRRMAAKSVTLVRTVLRQAFNQAMLWGLATRNPVTDTQSPKIARSSAKALTNTQAAAFLEAARGERLELALSLGLRRGEGVGCAGLGERSGLIYATQDRQRPTGLCAPKRAPAGIQALQGEGRVRAQGDAGEVDST